MAMIELFERRCRELASLQLTPLVGTCVAPDSMPVLYFGATGAATMMTVGINPSSKEFLSPSRDPLTGAQRRFLHASEATGGLRVDGEVAIDRMDHYFRRSPDVAYWQWFRPVEQLLNAFGCSFKDGTGAHTDVVSCFATYPAWSRLDPEVQQRFAASGFETFREVIAAAPVVQQIIILGATAAKAFGRGTYVELAPIGTPFDDMPKCRSFKPVLSAGYWQPQPGRRLSVVVVRPYRNLPTLPLGSNEVAELPRYLEKAGF